MKKRIALILAAALCAAPTFAKTKTAKSETKNFDYSEFQYAWPTEADLQKWASVSEKERKRRPAANDEYQTLLENQANEDAEFKEFREKYFELDLSGANGPMKLEGFIKSYVDRVNGTAQPKVTSPIVRLAVTQMALVQPLRAFAYRIKPILDGSAVDRAFNSASKVTHSLLVTGAQVAVNGQRSFLPQRHWDAVARYVTEPFTEKDVNGRITTSEQFQTYLHSELHRTVNWANFQIADLLRSNERIILDFKIFYPGKSASDPLGSGFDRYREVGKAELAALLSVYEANQAALSFVNAYNLNGVREISGSAGMILGFDGGFLGGGELEGSTAQKRAGEIRKHAAFLTYRGGRGLELSLKHLQASVAYAKLAKDSLQNSNQQNPPFILSAQLITPASKQIDLSLDKLNEILTRDTTVVSELTGEAIRIDMPSLFSDATACRDLKNFLPVAFAGNGNGAAMKSKKISIKGKEVNQTYRDFAYGSATAWNLDSTGCFKKVFPDLKPEDQNKIPAAGRILASAFGTSGVASLMSLVLL